MNPLTHVFESTLFAGAVWLATLALRRNRARTRHALWMAASMKFLVPFALLVSLGSHAAPRHSASVPPTDAIRAGGCGSADAAFGCSPSRPE